MHLNECQPIIIIMDAYKYLLSNKLFRRDGNRYKGMLLMPKCKVIYLNILNRQLNDAVIYVKIDCLKYDDN